jgi:hypothetical protein
VNCADYDRRTALHVAAASGERRAVGALLFKGADAGLVDRWGQKPADGIASKACAAMLREPIAARETFAQFAQPSAGSSSSSSSSSSGGGGQGKLKPVKLKGMGNAVAPISSALEFGNVDGGGEGGKEGGEMSLATKELLDAAVRGDLKAVVTLVKRGGDCGASDYDRRTW